MPSLGGESNAKVPRKHFLFLLVGDSVGGKSLMIIDCCWRINLLVIFTDYWIGTCDSFVHWRAQLTSQGAGGSWCLGALIPTRSLWACHGQWAQVVSMLAHWVLELVPKQSRWREWGRKRSCAAGWTFECVVERRVSRGLVKPWKLMSGALGRRGVWSPSSHAYHIQVSVAGWEVR